MCFILLLSSFTNRLAFQASTNPALVAVGDLIVPPTATITLTRLTNTAHHMFFRVKKFGKFAAGIHSAFMWRNSLSIRFKPFISTSAVFLVTNTPKIAPSPRRTQCSTAFS